jgi:hypothetical protein
MPAVYPVRRLSFSPGLLAPIEDSSWSEAQVARVEWFHPAGSAHRPDVDVRMLYDEEALWVRFSVADRYVRCVHSQFQAPVYEDSCCELFVQPDPASTAYFNIEVNAIGALLASYITDPRRTPSGFVGQTLLDTSADSAIERETDLDGPLDAELASETQYEIAFRVPFGLLRQYGTVRVPSAGTRWRGNLYKCSENSSHPHWAAWSPIGAKLEYHQPALFGEFEFK